MWAKQNAGLDNLIIDDATPANEGKVKPKTIQERARDFRRLGKNERYIVGPALNSCLKLNRYQCQPMPERSGAWIDVTVQGLPKHKIRALLGVAS